jgi:hypothetical protein
LWDDPIISAVVLEDLLTVKRFVSIQMNLFADKKVTGRVINEDSATAVLKLHVFFAKCVQ